MYYKKFSHVLFFCLVFITLVGLLHVILDFGVKSVRVDQIGKINVIANHEMDTEIAIFGSSVSEVGIDPSILEKCTRLRCFNFSLNGTSFYQYRGLIDEFVSYSKLNKVVIFSETYFSFSKRDALMSPDLYLSQLSKENIRKPLEKIDPMLIRKSHYIPFYRFIAASHVYYKYAAKGIIDQIQGNIDKPNLKGFTPVKRNWEADADRAISKVGKYSIVIDQQVLKLYVEQIKRLQSKGIKVIIILTPIYKKALAQATNFTHLIAVMNEISQKTGADFLDFSNSNLTRQKKYFYNSNHLNLIGAQHFSKQLGDSISKLISVNGLN
jgi:hypothetical protein